VAGKASYDVITALLGLAPDIPVTWPIGAGPLQSEVAQHVGKTAGRISQILVKQRKVWLEEESLTELRNEVNSEIARHGGIMTGAELVQSILTLRGSAKNDPRRSLDAAAILRCVLETESAETNPRFAFRRGEATLLVALTTASATTEADHLFAYALALGSKADRLANLDPLLSPQRAREELESVPPPTSMDRLSHERLLRLAAGASQRARVAGTAEIYPKDLPVGRALKLASASFLTPREKGFNLNELESKLRLRYPEMAPMPGLSELQSLIESAGLDLRYDSEGRVFVPRSTSGSKSATASSAGTRLVTQLGQARQDSPEIAQAVATEEKLLAAQKGGGFLVIGTQP
ncbi:MAG TPA: hypothetical protein PKA37_18480, partial [Planctomycetota bacterium]|nr:hypothetical protein [Planctomycetota bacterium]